MSVSQKVSGIEPSFSIQRAAERARFDFGWLDTHHSFSFGEYYDPENQNWGALRVLNDDVVAPGMGFGTHPHRDMEILTYVLSGELEHRDSMGNVGVVKPGGVQYLSAGTGIAHSEYNHSKTAPVHFVQMWVIPQARGLKPRYGQVDYTLEQRLNRWLPIATGRPGVETPIAIWQDATAYVARVEGATLSTHVDAGRRAFLFVGDGSVEANGEALVAGDAVRIAGPLDVNVSGTGELILWDVPPLAG
jgi:redox-sensitive bicupin YhaK (pirin superfamily)